MGKTVSDGCIYHVVLPLDGHAVLAANDVKLYKMVSKAAASKTHSDFTEACKQEMLEGRKVEAARDAIERTVKIGLRTLLSAQKLPELVVQDDALELRLLLCYRDKAAVEI